MISHFESDADVVRCENGSIYSFQWWIYLSDYIRMMVHQFIAFNEKYICQIIRMMFHLASDVWCSLLRDDVARKNHKNPLVLGKIYTSFLCYISQLIWSYLQCKVCMQTFICTTSEVKCKEHAEAKHPKADLVACFPHLKKWREARVFICLWSISVFSV